MNISTWKVKTTKEKAGSFFLSYAVGEIHLEHDQTGELMIVSYRTLGVGIGKDLFRFKGKIPVPGFSESQTSDASGALEDGYVGVVPGSNFDIFSFPCSGYMFGVSAQTGIIGSFFPVPVTGGGYTMVLFGQFPPFAGVKLWGTGRALIPGVGVNGNVAHFWVE